ncbi:hypothetical protein H310_03997 [Aphanomyces invadans]|uniref:Uncharacterized protein n=1 Tax=Aphanomyces invadans TaxID=157072 RepID=A0A024UF57_9STRA|nr:hypothetical protein H310_03997 [Aphanomyces invadans]ETW04889.1 hypothetical protein H310_03997 [Aphanomyces invadans]RHY32608.1 hypothetical protein DYB32_002597 [Aphanomyces invadans]|eukprot:XP_008866327.1 hypothetical protein H310_03997 [Aphanomyces invadans]
MHLPRAIAAALFALLALPSTCQTTLTPTTPLPSSTYEDVDDPGNDALDAADGDPVEGGLLNDTATTPVTTPRERYDHAEGPIPVLGAQATKPSSDGSTTTVLLSIAVGLSASVVAAIVIVSRRRNAQFQAEMDMATENDYGMAMMDLPENYDQDGSEDQYSVHSLSTRRKSSLIAHRDLTSSVIRTSNILAPRPYHQPPANAREDVDSFVDESLFLHTTHSLTRIDSASPINDNAMMVLRATTSEGYLDTAHFLQTIHSTFPRTEFFGDKSREHVEII